MLLCLGRFLAYSDDRALPALLHWSQIAESQLDGERKNVSDAFSVERSWSRSPNNLFQNCVALRLFNSSNLNHPTIDFR
jgi:hypothetical protein